MSIHKIKQLYRGLRKAASLFDVHIVGGDTVKSKIMSVNVAMVDLLIRKMLLNEMELDQVISYFLQGLWADLL